MPVSQPIHFCSMFLQVYGHQRPDDGTAERFNKTRRRQREKSCENAFEVAGGQKWGSTEPRCQVVSTSAVIAIVLGSDKAAAGGRECLRVEPGPAALAPSSSLTLQGLPLSCRARQFLSLLIFRKGEHTDIFVDDVGDVDRCRRFWN